MDAERAQQRAQQTADAMARATGSVYATVTIEYREADGSLTTVAVARSTPREEG